MPQCRVGGGQGYFDPEGDEELMMSKSVEGDYFLNWRGDPSSTLADWSIVVVTNELQATTYHVHKSALCFGSRQSKYFAKIMVNNTPNKTNGYKSPPKGSSIPTTKVELDQQDADNFPLFLDFIYAPSQHMSSCNGTVITAASTQSSALCSVPPDDESTYMRIDEVTTENAVSLRSLARKFEVDALMLAVNKFIQKDLSFKTGPLYLSKASEYNDERLFEAAQKLCAENIQQIDMKTLLRLPIHLFRVVVLSLESFEEDNHDVSLYISEVVCRYLEKHHKYRSVDLLLEFTDPLLMPYIASEAAIGYTALIKNLDEEEAASNWDRLVDLSRRCAKAVVLEYGWNDFSVNAAVGEYLGNVQGSTNGISKLDSLLFATSFAAALEQAQDDYESIIVEQERLESLLNSVIQSVAMLEKSNARKDEHLAKQQRAIGEARKHIGKLKKQVGEIKQNQVKVPKSHPISEQYEDAAIDAAIRDLVSPSQIGLEVHAKKTRKIKELRSMSEMRSRSLIR